MNINDYVQASMRSDSSDYDIIVKRAKECRVVDVVLSSMALNGALLDAMKKQIFYGKDHSPTQASELEITQPLMEFFHALLGLYTEVGEIAETLLAAAKDGKQLDIVNLVEEGGDVNWYNAKLLDAIQKYCSVTPDSVLDINVAKLKLRYPDKFSEKDALERKDKA
jgi:NTP pyrophosphatase (non-canonical NTP hydrolase)